MTDTEAGIVSAWKEAAADLGIRFTSPFVVRLPDGRSQEYLGLIHRFGRHIGTLISTTNETSERAPHLADDDYFFSVLRPGYVRYARQKFIDTLDDWRFFGPESERPKWYSGKSWT